MVALARAGRGKMLPLYKKAPKVALDGQQAQAVSHVLTTTDRVSIIRGAAGSGKTTLMKEAADHIAKAGKTVTVVAPTAEASRGVLKEEGFENAQTVAQLLVDKKMQEKLKDQVLWVDEAGLLGTRDMTALLEISHQQNARLVLGGDTRQHSSVVRGDALRILNTVGGIKSAEVSKIYRQKSESYRSIVQDLSAGNIKQAFEKLEQHGAIKEVDPMEPDAALVDDYVNILKEGKSALVISPTHQQGGAITKSIRTRLQQKGQLGKKEIKATRYTNLNLTQAQKADYRNLPQGQMVQFNQNLPGIRRGSIWTVGQSSDHSVYIKGEQNRQVMLPVENSGSYEVYKQGEIALAKGDLVRITRNGFDQDKKRLNNGQILQVESVKKSGDITLMNSASQNRYQISQDFGHLTHAYCITSHASQGKTVDEVLLYQPSSTFEATDAKQLYVSVSRGRERVSIYTDDKAELLEHAKRIGDRKSAIELVTNNDKVWQHGMQRIREEMYKREHRQVKEPVDIQKPIRVKKDRGYEPGI